MWPEVTSSQKHWGNAYGLPILRQKVLLGFQAGPGRQKQPAANVG